MNLSLISVVNVQNRVKLFAQKFIEYYKALGVDFFYLILNGSDSDIQTFCDFLTQSQVNFFFYPWIGTYHSNERNAYIRLINNHIGNQLTSEDWVLTVDSDEFFVPPKNLSMRDFIDSLIEKKVDYVVSFLVDMVSSAGVFDVVEDGDNLIEKFSIPTLLSQDLLGVKIEKVPLSKFIVKRERGSYHNIKIRDMVEFEPLQKIIPIRHIRWHSDIISELCQRTEMYRSDPYTKMKAERYANVGILKENPEKINQYILENESIAVFPKYKGIARNPRDWLRVYHNNGKYGTAAKYQEGRDLVTKIDLSEVGIQVEKTNVNGL